MNEDRMFKGIEYDRDGNPVGDEATAQHEMRIDAEQEPSHDDTVPCCPDCERPNQFGERCADCERDIQVGLAENRL